MATKKITKMKFSVGGFVRIWSEVEITAATIDEALTKSKDLKIDDFLAGRYNDHSVRVINVYDPDFEI